MNRRELLSAVTLGAGLPITTSRACLWDRDTLDEEAKKAPGYTAVITGRFPRNPARYYEMRLTRVGEEIKENPEKLALYDDAGVACDRLGKGAEAIEWMKKKRAVLDAEKDHPEHANHEYRYLANLGTFQIHKWLGEGATAATRDMATTALENIAKAIDLNPDAHFGRERYQFMAIDWILQTLGGESDSPTFLRRSKYYTERLGDRKTTRMEDCSGIAGLIYLGNAWESQDVFRTLGQALSYAQNASLAHLAYLREEEIRKAGGKSFYRGEERPIIVMIESEKIRRRNETFFREAREEADRWLAARNAFMEQQFLKGLHPDTHKDFWDGAVYHGKPPKFNGKEVL